MRRCPPYWFLLFLGIAANGMVCAAQGGQRIALLIGISDYPVKSGWTSIGAGHDVVLLQDALNKQGFKAENILVCKDQRTDIQGLRKAFKQLYEKTNRGSIVYLHFSAHGQQITDDNGDEPDGYDEAIVSLNAPASPERGKRYDLHLRDDEIGRWVDSIRLKAGPEGDVLVVLDACYSGTGTRSGLTTGLAPGQKVRGNGKPFGPPADNRNMSLNEARNEDMDLPAAAVAQKAGYTVFSAARHDEKNYEYGGLGSLSQSIVNALSEIQPGESYRSFFSRVCGQMVGIVPQQNPIAEGMLDRQVFGGQVLAQQRFFTLARISGSRGVLMNGGTMMGIQKGTRVALMAAGSSRLDSPKVIAYGEVQYAGATQSDVSFPVKVTTTYAGKHRQFWVFETEKSPGDLRVRIFADVRSLAIDTTGLFGVLRKSTAVEVSNNLQTAEVLIQKQDRYYRLLAVADQALLADSFKYPLEVRNWLENYAIGKAIRNMRFHDPSLHVSLSFVPVNLIRKQTDGRWTVEVGDTLPVATLVRDGIVQVSPFDHVVMRIENKGTRGAYFNIIDIQPDNMLNQILPAPEGTESPSGYYLAPGQVWYSGWKNRPGSTFQEFGPPYGREVYRVFATSEAVDLRNIYRTRGKGTYRHSLEHGLASIYKLPASRDAGTPIISPGTHTFDFTFEIIPGRL